MTKATLAAAVLLAAVSSSSSAAQTPEELVAFIFEGIEDGAAVVDPDPPEPRERWRRDSASPARFSAPGYTVEVRRQTDCEYVLEIEAAGVAVQTRLDFARIREFRVDGGAATFKGDGYCETPITGGACSILNVFTNSADINPSRRRQAYDQLRARFCSERPS